MQAVRGAAISLIFQEPMTALNPVFTIGNQIEETLLVHGRATRRPRRARAIELLDAVSVPEPHERVRDYPAPVVRRPAPARAHRHGARVRARRWSSPTSRRRRSTSRSRRRFSICSARSRSGCGLALLLITHDLGVVAEMADRVAVMYAGRIVEEAPVRELFADPKHPYTRGLIASMPGGAPGSRLHAIQGTVPPLGTLPPGCAFAPRCPERFEPCARALRETRCSAAPSARRSAIGLDVRRSALGEVLPARTRGRTGGEPVMPLLEVADLTKEFPRKGSLFGKGSMVRAVDDVSFSIDEGETFGLVGESGSGKTTTGRCILRLIEPTSGRGAVQRRRRPRVLALAHAPGAARHADRLPGSLLVAQSAHARRRHRRRAAHHPRHRVEGRAARARRGAVRARRPRPGAARRGIRTSSAAASASASGWRARSR